MLVVEDDRDNNRNNDNFDQYIMDSGITPPSANILTRWSHDSI